MVRAAVELVATACWAWRLKSTLSRWPEVASFGRYPTRSTHSSQQLLDRTHDHRHTGLDLRSPRPALLSAVAALTAPGQQKTSLYPSYFDVDLFFHSEHMDRTTLASGIIFSHGVYTWQMHTVCSALLCFALLSLFSCARCCVGSLAVATPTLLHYISLTRPTVYLYSIYHFFLTRRCSSHIELGPHSLTARTPHRVARFTLYFFFALTLHSWLLFGLCLRFAELRYIGVHATPCIST
jgi:hypothetical protein